MAGAEDATRGNSHQAKRIRLGGPSDIHEKIGMIPSMAALVRSMDRRLCQIAATWFHQLLMNEPNPPVKEVVGSGVVYVFVLFLTSDKFKELQEMAADVLILIASGKFVKTKDWDPGLRTKGALSYLLNSEDLEVLRHGCISVAVLSSSQDVNVKHPIKEAGLCSRLYDIILCPPLSKGHYPPSIVLGALRTFGNVMEKYESVTKTMGQSGLFGLLTKLLKDANVDIQREACRICCHLSAIPELREDVFERGLVDLVVNMLGLADIGSKRVATKTIAIATSGANDDQIRVRAFKNWIEVLCLHLCCKDKQVLSWSLEALENIMKCGKEIGDNENDDDVNRYAKAMYEVGGWRLLRERYSRYEYEIHFKALKLQKRYAVYPVKSG